MDPILLLVLFVLFALGGKKGNGGGGKGAVGGFDPLPLPDPDPKPKPAILGTPDPIDPGGGGGEGLPLPGELQISDDCMVVTESPGWWTGGAEALAAQLVADGFGLPVYTAANASRSVDAVIRTVVAKTAGTGCIDAAPWLDRYVKENPIPALSEGQTREGYLFELAAWDDAWDLKISQWSAAHPQAFNLFRKIGNAVTYMWAGQYAQAPAGDPRGGVGDGTGDPGAPPPSGQGGNASAAEVNQLRALGYDISPEAAELFQQDYNLLRNYQTLYQWRNFGLEIDTDGVVGPQTRTALLEALSMASGSADQWRLMIAGAHAGA